MSGTLIVLGPQRPTPNLAESMTREGLHGPVVLITAGWRHDEFDLEAIQRELAPREVRHLPVYHWYETLQDEAPALFDPHKDSQARIRTTKSLYRTRLHAALEAVETLRDRRERDPAYFEEEYADAIEHLKHVDARRIALTDKIRTEFPDLARTPEHPAVIARHDEAKRAFAGAESVLIAGGHVAVLLNRLKFFGVDELLASFHAQGGSVVAWSAGAMVLSELIVLFYDDPPDERGGAEVLEPGMGILKGHVVMPHARRRLHTDDVERMKRLAARFSPRRCLLMENGACVVVQRGKIAAVHSRPETGSIVRADGTLGPVEVGT